MNGYHEHFKIKSLTKDHDALLLIGLSVALGVGFIAALALMSAEHWNNLVQRANMLWAASLVVAPTLLAVWSRYKLRSRAVEAAGNAAQPSLTSRPSGNAPAGVKKVGK